MSILTKLSLTVLWLALSVGSAAAQYGVSSQRDANGNLRRENADYSPRGINQGPVNNGPIRNTPAQPSTTNGSTQQRAVR
ncbi:hypothetical protein [Bradyrhizobium sp. STM 3809]|uniref:hypothetical protein n=1 Tax=Bradyrhizobium sp. STM 3809 TaxID=551936 RepID=UPI001112460D|nr:hypothetical protein [Bradyrhizobium sp. STM 3809]